MEQQRDSIPLIIDTDMAPDDWVAILYLGKRKDVEIKAITISGTGEVHGKKGAKNCLRLLKMINRDNIPVAFGISKPLRYSHHFPKTMRFAVDRRLFIKFPKSKKEPKALNAIDLFKEKILNSHHKKIAILALGPLTNVANLIKQYPKVKKNISKIYIMGGAVDVPGNIAHVSRRIDNPYAEWNIYCDPHAANIVFQSEIPIFLVPLDATNKVPIGKGFIKRINKHQDNMICKFIGKIIKRLGSRLEERNIAFWDLIAAICVNAEEIARVETRMLRVIDKEGIESGRIIEDKDKGKQVQVCKQIDKKKYNTKFFQTILS